MRALLLTAFLTGLAPAICFGAPNDRWAILSVGKDTGQDVPRGDLAKASRTDTVVRLWVLTNHTKDEVFPDKSASDKIQWEYDCKQQRTRRLAVLTFPKRDGNGKPITSIYEPTDWKPVIPDSIGEAQVEFVCGNVMPVAEFK